MKNTVLLWKGCLCKNSNNLQKIVDVTGLTDIYIYVYIA